MGHLSFFGIILMSFSLRTLSRISTLLPGKLAVFHLLWCQPRLFMSATDSYNGERDSRSHFHRLHAYIYSYSCEDTHRNIGVVINCKKSEERILDEKNWEWGVEEKNFKNINLKKIEGKFFQKILSALAPRFRRKIFLLNFFEIFSLNPFSQYFIGKFFL